jgi:dTDP-4-amino-4,6-dideoxygalactose transaminase
VIPVTKPFLPPLEEYYSYLDGIWKRGWLTNNGPLVNELEMKLKEHLNVPHFLFLSNGTVAIQIAIKALEIRGEIITTPFSYVATTSSIVWENCSPVFVDIDPNTLNIEASKIEAAITDRTTAILATHVFGNPCDIDTIEVIAKRNNLKVIYDSAHCFGTLYKGKSVFSYGDVSTSSFHATKLYHTIEGGGVFTSNSDLLRKMSLMRNFGHDGMEKFSGMGINGKNSEFHAAMGLLNLRFINSILTMRKKQYEYYQHILQGLDVKLQTLNPDSNPNYSYFPILFKSESKLLSSVKVLNDNWIYPRRYFYPSLNKLEYVKDQPCPVSEEVSKCILCLPLYMELSIAEQDMIARLLLRIQNN